MSIKMSFIIAAIISLVAFSAEERLIPNRNFNAKEISKITSLPPITPTLIKPLIHSVQEKTKALQSLKNIIGFLPPSEQIALLKSFDTSSTSPNVFDFDKYLEYLVIKTGESEINLVLEQQRSLSEMLSANAKRFRAGLGCLKKVSTQVSTFEDENLLQNVNVNIEDLLVASNQLNHCEMNFLKVLFETINKKKAIITEITTDNYGIPEITDNFSSQNNIITDIKYGAEEIKTIIKEFKNYATCHQAFNNLIHSKILENIISIGQMKQCLDRDSPNKNAGRSSKEYKNPSMNYKGDQVIGINNATGIRADRRTQNNYLLNKGYGYGKININFDQTTNNFIFPIPIEWEAILITLESNAWSDLKTKVTSLLNGSKQVNYFPDLHNFLIQTMNVDPLPFQLFLKKKCNNNNLKLECNTNQCKIIEGSTPPDPNFTDFKFVSTPYEEYYKSASPLSNNYSGVYNFNFAMTDPYIAVICNGGNIQIYSEATHPLFGKVIEYYDNGNSLGNDINSIDQSCIGVFTAGGKNDKDACRDTMKKECGSELDYRCKESGLYDYINQNPPAKTVLPPDCIGNDDLVCFRWIAKQFILGSISVNPSGFLSYNLNSQMEGTIDNQYYIEPKENTNSPITNIKYKKMLDITNGKNLFYVEENKPGIFTEIGKFHIEMDRTTIIQITKGHFIQKQYFVSLMILLILF